MDTAIHSISNLLNRILALDPETLQALARYRGRTLAIHLEETRLDLFLTILEQGVILSLDEPEQVDVSVRGTPSEFLAFLRGSGGRGTGAAGTIEIAGDVGMAQQLQGIIRNLDLDWEEPLSGLVGDTLARQTGRLFRGTAEYLGGAGRTLGADLSEYLRYEKGILPDSTEVEEFRAEVEMLRQDVDRLQARIERLLNRTAS